MAGERFDLVLCFHAFPHFRDQSAALRHLAAALRPEGQLVVLHLCGSARLNAFHGQIGGAVGHDVLPAGEAWQPLLRQAGLRLASLEDRDDLFRLHAEPAHSGQ